MLRCGSLCSGKARTSGKRGGDREERIKVPGHTLLKLGRITYKSTFSGSTEQGLDFTFWHLCFVEVPQGLPFCNRQCLEAHDEGSRFPFGVVKTSDFLCGNVSKWDSVPGNIIRVLLVSLYTDQRWELFTFSG